MKKLTAVFIAIVLCIMAVGCSDDVKAPETAGTDITVITTDLTDSDTKIITADTDTTEVTTAENTPILMETEVHLSFIRLRTRRGMWCGFSAPFTWDATIITHCPIM